jgi:hypothetical protein
MIEHIAILVSESLIGPAKQDGSSNTTPGLLWMTSFLGSTRLKFQFVLPVLYLSKIHLKLSQASTFVSSVISLFLNRSRTWMLSA